MRALQDVARVSETVCSKGQRERATKKCSDVECKGSVVPKALCSSVDANSVVGLSTLVDRSIPVREAVPVGRVKTRYVAGQRFSRAKITSRVSGAPLRRVGFTAPRSPGAVLGSKHPGGGITSSVQMEVEDISNLDGLVQGTCVAVEQSLFEL